MTDKFTVTPIQNGRFIEIESTGMLGSLTLTRLEAINLVADLERAIDE